MTRIISLALGNMWSWTTSKNRNDLVDYARKVDVSGVEITFTSKEELYALKLSEINKAWLKKLDYVSIHAPFTLRLVKNKEELIRQLNKISILYKELNAKNVIIHPDALPALDILKKYDLKVSTENLVPKKRIDLQSLKKILDKYPSIGLCLDTSHSYLWSKDETANLINAFKDKITQIHLSGAYRKKTHQSMRKVNKDFLASIEPIKELDIPIVIEEDIKVKSLKYIKEEVEYIKKMFTP